ncbi:unnamed protein product [Penicillium salamii]|nr:unnamed protein product [Penicillium salamii]
MPQYMGAAIATVKHTCWEFYRRIGDKTKASLRRVLHRVFPLDLTAFTLNGGVYEPLAVRVARSYRFTTVQFISTNEFVTRLWL